MGTLTTVLFFVGEEQAPEMQVELVADDRACITIHAGTFAEAEEMYKQAKERTDKLYDIAEGISRIKQAEQKIIPMPGLAPEEVAKQSPDYETESGTRLVSARTVERMAADRAAFEATPKGQRFIHMLETAKAFRIKHMGRSRGLLVEELDYLANKHENSLFNSFFDIEAITYRRAYQQGYKDAKKKKI